MKSKQKNTKKIVVAVVALVVVVAALWGVYAAFGPKASAGDKTIVVQTVFADGTDKEWTIHTDAEFLRGALEQENLVGGTESEYGLYVTTVAGVTADEANQEWWCFTQNGEDVYTGVDATPIADGDHYEITLMQGW